MNNPERKEYTRLHRAGLDLNTQPTFETNGGSETTTHAVAKLITARLFLEEGWLADCEVTLQNGREMDVFAYNHDRLNYAIELENNPRDGIKREKLKHYVDTNTVVDDMLLLDITNAPTDIDDLERWLADRAGVW
jgi:hypothetical protein